MTNANPWLSCMFQQCSSLFDAFKEKLSAFFRLLTYTYNGFQSALTDAVFVLFNDLSVTWGYRLALRQTSNLLQFQMGLKTLLWTKAG